jgi:hypothetical protein
MTSFHNFRITFLTPTYSEMSYQHGPDSPPLQIYSTLKCERTTGGHDSTRRLLKMWLCVLQTVCNCVYNRCSKWPLSGWIRSLAVFSAPTEIAVCHSRLVVTLMSCWPRGIFSKNSSSLIFQIVNVNVTCQSHAFAMKRAENYRQAKISEFTVPEVSNGRGWDPY